MFSLSRPSKLLFLLCFIASWTCVVVSVILYPCILCVALLMDLFVLCVACLTVFVNCLGVFAIFCLMLWKCLVWVDVLCWIDRVWSSKECSCCACNPRVHLSGPSYVCVCRKLSPHLRV